MLFNSAEKEKDALLPEPNDKMHWEALLRGQILAVTTQKIVSYITLADQKAQAMIILNSILIPVALNWVSEPIFRIGATVSIGTSIFSILAAIMCIYPKRRNGRKPDGTRNPLHFTDIGHMREKDYLRVFSPIFNDLSLLSEVVIKDIHDVSRHILRPKYTWLKASYGCFFLGNLIAIILAFYASWNMQATP